MRRKEDTAKRALAILTGNYVPPRKQRGYPHWTLIIQGRAYRWFKNGRMQWRDRSEFTPRQWDALLERLTMSKGF